MNGIECDVIDSGENTVVGDYVDDIDDDMPFEILQNAREAVMETLPKLSREKYTRVYNNFKEWQKKHGTGSVSNELILAYFHELATKKKYKPTSLWAYFSMLKATLRSYENVHIEKYKQVSAYLSARSAGYKAKKARVFSEDNIKTFIDQADELSWLDVKVATIFGICGALRTDEYTRIKLDDVEKHGDMFLVKIHQTKNKWPRCFIIGGSFAVLVKKFIALRPVGLQSSDRIFTNYQRGKCTRQFMGENKFSNMPRRVAEYLGLPEPERYTGHSFRRTSATFLANSGADIETIMRHCGWRSASCAKEYIEDSLAYKIRTGNMIQQSIQDTSVSFASAANVSFESMNTSINGPMQSPMNGQMSAPIQSPMNEPMSAPIQSPMSAPIQSPMNEPMSAPIQSPMNEPMSAPIQSPMSAPIQSPLNEPMSAAMQSSANPYVQVVPPPTVSAIHDMFDSAISNDDLIEITDCVSQSYEQSKEMFLGNVGGRDIGDVSESATVLTQSKSNSLNAILSRSFKSINFGRMNNCNINFDFK